MGNLNTKDIGDTQESVGKVGAEVNMIGAYFIAAIMILFAIAAAIMAFIPTNSVNCDKDQQQVDFLCNEPVLAQDQCDNAKIKLASDKCSVKTKKYALLFFLLLIPLALFIVWYAKWWKNMVYTNRTAAEIGGAATEVSIFNGLFGRR